MKWLLIFLLTFNLYAANKKFTDLASTAITATATDDIFAIVDTSSDTSRHITFDELNKKYYNTLYTDTATFAGNVDVGGMFTSTGTAYLKSYLIMVSPDSSCSACSVDNADTFSCTATTCP